MFADPVSVVGSLLLLAVAWAMVVEGVILRVQDSPPSQEQHPGIAPSRKRQRSK